MECTLVFQEWLFPNSPIGYKSNSQYRFEVGYKGKHGILDQDSKHLHRVHQTGGKEEISTAAIHILILL